jgi:hypothetical protein
VEQLVEDNVATHVVPNAATHVPATCDLFPATITALKAKRYSGLPSVIRKELADDAGLVVALSIVGGDFTKLPGGQKLREQTIDVLTTLIKLAGGKNLKASKNTALCSYPQSTPAVATSVLQACANTQADEGVELACALGLATRDDANGDSALVPGDLKKALNAIAAAAVKKTFSTEVPDFLTALKYINLAEAGTLDTEFPTASALKSVIQSLANQISVLANAPSKSLEQVVAALGQFAALCSGAELAKGKLGTPSPNFDLTTWLSQNLAVSISVVTSNAPNVVADIKGKNYGAAVKDSFETFNDVIDGKCPKKKPATGLCSNTDRLVRKFLQAAAVYAVDSASSGGAGSSVSSDFRAAAVDLIEATGGAGIRRKTFVTTSEQNPGWFFPNFALRVALRPGFAGPTDPGTDSSALFTYASMDWPSLRFKIYPSSRSQKPLWVGGNISFIDAIGPLVELAARNRSLGSTGSASTRYKAIALGFVVPRVEFELGVPELTRNLVVGLGAAARLYRADQSSPTTTVTPIIATYCLAGQTGCDGASFNSRNLEGSIFVKYVP